MINKNNQCEHTLTIRHKLGYYHTGCGKLGGEVPDYEDWKVGEVDTCQYCGLESINVKKRTVRKSKRGEAMK
jgi:hypothetical protein